MRRKALILAGGPGKTLQPLSFSRPVTLIELCNKPILFHQMDALIDVGINYIVIAVDYMSQMIEEAVKTYTKDKSVEVIISKNDYLEPGSAFAAAKHYLIGEEPFIMIYGNVVCDYPFQQMMDFHKQECAEGTIMVLKSVKLTENENADQIRDIDINILDKTLSGIYIFSCSVLDKLPKEEGSIAKIISKFPKDFKLCQFVNKHYFAIVKNPTKFLFASMHHLRHCNNIASNTADDSNIKTINPPIDPSVIIGTDCYIGKYVVIGENVTIGDGVYLNDCVILSGSNIKSHSRIEKSTIGWGCIIGKWVSILNNSILGEGVTVKDGVWIFSSKIFPRKCICESQNQVYA